MIRSSEAVLAGHPDKFCDQIADAILAAAYTTDPGAYAQIEVATWSDWLWINGAVATKEPFAADLQQVILKLGVEIGYCRDDLRYDPYDKGCNHIDVQRYRIFDAICRPQEHPRLRTGGVNDQSLVIGWAGYDEKVRYLPPEHFLAHSLREALDASFLQSGILEKQGPDGKLLVRVRENVHPGDCRRNTWEIEQILVTVQQRQENEFGAVQEGVAHAVRKAVEELASADPRWRAEWRDIDLLVNPNGPLIAAGSDGDNGQTGRKLVMDYYGPRVPLGGGALSGKDLAHIDRAGAYAARKACVEAVAAGQDSCEVFLAYAPGSPDPLDVRWTSDRRSSIPVDRARFTHGATRTLALSALRTMSLVDLAKGNHFFAPEAPWNKPTGG